MINRYGCGPLTTIEVLQAAMKSARGAQERARLEVEMRSDETLSFQRTIDDNQKLIDDLERSLKQLQGK